MVGFVLTSSINAQAPQAFKFQSVIRDASGMVLPLQDITLKFLIHANAPDGEVVYAEQHFVTTNASGLANVDIGTGEIISGTFEGISWGDGTYYMEEQIDVGNTGDFQVFGTVQLLSVPYALHANTAGNGIQSMSEEERNAIEGPAVGMQIYNTTTNCLNYWNGTNWFETCGECTPQPSDAHAGSDQSYTDSTTVVILEGNTPEEGTGLWTKITSYPGWFEDPNDPNSTFHGEPCRYYYLKWTISNTCGSDDDYVKVTFDHLASEANAGQDTVIITEATEITLYAQAPESGSGEWSVISGDGGEFIDPSDPTTTFTGLSCNTYELEWQVSTECYENMDSLSISFDAIPTPAYAGQDTIINDDNLTIQLNANEALLGNGEWSIYSGEGGMFSENTNPQTEFTGEACTNYELLWVISTDCHSSTDTVNVNFYSIPTQADAGEDQLGLEGTWTTLAANEPEIGEGLWTILQGEGGQVTTPNSPNSIFLGQMNQHYILEWSIATVCDTTRDELEIAFGFVPSDCGSSFTDPRDGQIYNTVLIGEQCWMAENLSYLPSVSPSSEGSETDPYYYVNNYQGTNVDEAKATDNYQNYGSLYNWPASITACPEGWHLPTDAEWTILIDPLGGSGVGSDAGGKMKSTRTEPDPHPRWNNPNTDATNSSGFSGLPGGYRIAENGSFIGIGLWGYWWSSTENSDIDAWGRTLYYSESQVNRGAQTKDYGFIVRCLMGEGVPVNQPPNPPSNPQPETGASSITLDTTLSWTCTDPDGDPLTYDVYFGTETTPLQVATGIADTFYTPGTLEYATTYYWKIIAQDDQGNSTEGEVWNFTTEFNGEYMPTEGLVGWWPFNGNANDESGNENDGQLNNVESTQSKVGDANGAFTFSGENSYIRFFQPFFGGNQISEFSMFARVKPTQAGNIWGKSFSWGEVNFRIIEDSTVAIVWANANNGNTYSVIQSITPIEFDVWTDIILTFDNSIAHFYYNGEQVPIEYNWIAQGGGVISTTEVNTLVNFAQDANSNNIGYKITAGQPGDYYEGVIDEFAIWNRALSPEEAFNIYASSPEQSQVISNPIPDNGASNISTDVNLSWSCTDPENDPLTYDVYFGTEPTPPQVSTGIADTFYTPGTFEYATTYFWKIVAHDDQGNTTEGEVWTFTTGNGIWDCGELLIDERDGQQYETVLIDNQCWMAENLAYLPSVSPPSQGSDTDPYYYVYEYQGISVTEAKATNNYQNYSVLYNWPASLDACPEGWHLPTDAEWCTLEQEVDPTITCSSTGWRGVDGGTKLIQGGSSGFEALLAGYRFTDGSFSSLGLIATFWSSSESGSDAWFRQLLVSYAPVYRGISYKGYGYSVRCLQDY